MIRFTKNALIATAINIAGVAAAVTLFIWPNYREAARCRAEIVELHTKIRDLEGQTQLVNQLEQELNSALDHIERHMKEIPASPDLAGLVRRLSQEVDRIIVLDQTFTAGSPGDAITGGKSTIQAMPLTIDMESTFDSLFALIRNVESVDRLVRISTLRISSKRDGKNGEAMVKAAIGVEAIYQPNADASQAPGVDARQANAAPPSSARTSIATAQQEGP